MLGSGDAREKSLVVSDKLVVLYTPFGNDWHSLLEEVGSKEVRWKYFSDQKRHFWQAILKRPNFNTAIAGLRAVLYAKRYNARLLVTIGPRLLVWIVLPAVQNYGGPRRLRL